MLADRFGRIATDLRVALTDRCNLRCAYCMPPEGLDWLPRADQLTDDEAAALLAYCVERGYELRFIEQMPLDAQHGWKRAEMVTAEEILAELGREFILTPDDPRRRGSAPAEAFLVNGGPARVGVIGSVTRPFCGTCDRVRLTADGQIRNCLFARTENDLRGPLRAGASDAELAAAWQRAVAVKLPGHGINDPSFLQPDRPMSAIGG